ncbi:uncharacterized protein LOC144139261 [Haemaphysalis longicornis]
MEPVATPHLSLVDIQEMAGCFTGAVVDLNVPCTAARGNMCHVSMQMSTWNELLFPAQLQLREDSYVHSQMSLVSRSEPRVVDAPPEIMQKAVTCACCLLTSHHCVVAVDLSYEVYEKWEDELCEALKRNTSVTHLKIGHYCSKCCLSLPTVLLSMQNLVELEIGYGASTSQLHTALSTLVRSTASLKVLRIHLLEVRGDASELLISFFANSTLKELSLNDSLLGSVTSEHCNVLCQYIETNVTLTTLDIFGSKPCPSMASTLGCVLGALLRNKTMRNLSLTDIFLDSESIGRLTNFLGETHSLRCFKMILTKVTFGVDSPYQQEPNSGWISALARNTNIEEVTLSETFCSAQTWSAFLKSLSSNGSTLNVNIDVRASRDLEEFFAVVPKECMEHRVSFSSRVCAPFAEALEAKAVTSVTQYTLGDTKERMSLLSSCSHITSVRLILTWYVNEPLFIVIADYVESTITLEELFLDDLVPSLSRGGSLKCWSIFTRSLSRNRSIRKLRIRGRGFDAEAMELLADAVKSRRDTWRFEFSAGASAPQSVFVRRLSEGIADNFTLLSVTLTGWIQEDVMQEWFVVDETLRRNSGLLTRATLFATGILRDSCGALALERVSGHTALTKEVMRVASVGSGEAAAAIARALRSIEDMHVFMRLCGVVRERVVCLPSHDGRPQLDDLNEYCWMRVRRYLFIRDVQYCGRP